MAQVDGEAHLLRDDVHGPRFHAPCAERDDRWPALLFDQARDLEGHVRRSLQRVAPQVHRRCASMVCPAPDGDLPVVQAYNRLDDSYLYSFLVQHAALLDVQLEKGCQVASRGLAVAL